MKKILFCLVLICQICTAQNNISNANHSDRNNYLMVKHGYRLSYNNSLRHANWVAWVLMKSHIGTVERQNDFSPDTQLPEGFTVVTPQDYSRCGYDRGHLCNSQAWTDSLQNNQETFLMSNVIPQSPKCNRGTWKELEDYCQKLALDDKILIIYAGGYLTMGHFSQKNIDIPAFCWKIIFVKPDPKPICVLMPNQEGIKQGWQHYQVDLQHIETITGYKF
jgi:endonuclease G, mitochondrial